MKVNFNGSVRDGRDDVGYVIQGPNTKLLAAGDWSLYKPSLSKADIRATQMGIICIGQEL